MSAHDTYLTSELVGLLELQIQAKPEPQARR